MERELGKTALPLFVGIETAREALRRNPRLLDGRLLVAVAAHEVRREEQVQAVASPVIVGRSMKPVPA